jgi:hypothetical protein
MRGESLDATFSNVHAAYKFGWLPGFAEVIEREEPLVAEVDLNHRPYGLPLQQAVTLYVELSGAAEAEDDIHGDALSPESGLPSSESPIVYRRDRLGSTGPAGFPTRGKCAVVVKAAEVLLSSFRALPQCAS